MVICPQTRQISADGKDEALESYAGYIPGKFDEISGTFIAAGPRQMFDYGIDFYSPQSFVDSRGRRIMTGWMSRMDAGQEESCPTRAHGYIHCLSLPRVLTWEDGALRQRPVPELLSLRRFL
ncbi:MAG: glycoside hydrolase family 32 protein, partial [Clostridia bacterium]|nr:glycoside hydrolase family 32 protein [Clostridia bacterium]